MFLYDFAACGTVSADDVKQFCEMISHVTLVPSGMATASSASLYTLLGIILAVFWVSFFPPYVFSDVLGFSDPMGYMMSAVVWIVATILIAGSGLDAFASTVLYYEWGVNIQRPLVTTGVVLTVLHILISYGAALEKNERSVHTESQ